MLCAGIAGLAINMWVTTASSMITKKDETKPRISIDGCVPALNATAIVPEAVVEPQYVY